MRSFYLTISLFLVSIAGHAQHLYPRIGLTAAMNSYQLLDYDMKPRIGFTIGAGYDFNLTKTIAVQAELNYVQKKFKTEYEQTILLPAGNEVFEFHEAGSERYNFSYLELPLLLKVKLFHKNFFIMGGPAVSFGLGGSYKYTSDRTSVYLGHIHEEGSGKIRFDNSSTENTADIQCDNRWDIGFQLGIGALFFKRLQIECRQSFGSINVFENVDSKHRYLQLSFSTPITLKR